MRTPENNSNGEATTNKAASQRGAPPKVPLQMPPKVERHLLSPTDAKHQDILHQHQDKLLAKINAGEASPEDHYRFSQIRQRLNQITSAALTQMAATEEQTKPKAQRSVKNAGSFTTNNLAANETHRPRSATQSRDREGGRWVTLKHEEHGLRHILIGAPRGPRVDKMTGRVIQSYGRARGVKPTKPIHPPERADAKHLSQEQAKQQEVLYHQQHKLLKKINSGRASHAEHQRFADIRERLNELHEQAKKHKQETEAGNGAEQRGGEQVSERAEQPSTRLEEEASRSTDTEGGGSGAPGNQPTRQTPTEYIPASLAEVNRRLDRYERHFRKAGNQQLADWMLLLKSHVKEVGSGEALKQLASVTGTSQGKKSLRHGAIYEGEEAGWQSMSDFGKAYLDRYGITSIYDKGDTSGRPVISSISEAFGGRGSDYPGSFRPNEPQLANKLAEAKALPGLESSEDLSVLIGRPVTQLTDDVTSQLDQVYGKGQWILKPYEDYAFAGNGIFFPQRAEQIKKDAQNNLWSAGEHLARYGFHHLRDNNGRVIGILGNSGDSYTFGSEKYNNSIYGDVRRWGDLSAQAANNENGAELPFEGKHFMAQPAFPVVGITNQERAQGVTFKTGQEARTHILTRNGKVELIPHTTWLKNEPLPVVFESTETRAMAKAAVDAINALPDSEKQGQVYAPDIVKTANGYKVVEANPSNYSGPSGYLGDNPFIIDAYISHLTGQTPAHVQFIQRLLSKKDRQ